MIAVVFMLAITLSAVFGIVGLAFREIRVSSENNKAKNSYFTAEAGIEDAVYRLMRGKNLSSSYSVTLNNATANIEVTDIAASQKEINASGDFSGAQRILKASLLTGTDSASFFYGVQVGDGGLEMENNSIVNGNVYSNGSIEGENGAHITGDVVVAGGITILPSVEWATHNTDQFFATASSNRDIAQSFTAASEGNLAKVSVYLGKVGAPSGNITLKIANDNSGKPSTGNIASATIPNSSVGATPSWIDVSFSSSPNLTNGNKYWIVLDYGSNSATNYWNWRKDNTDAYANNTGKYTSNCCSGSPTWINAGGDLAFKVWIGGVNTSIDGLTIGDSISGSGRANLFINTTIHGSVCPNQYCITDNPSKENMPISDGLVQDWKNAALAGGTCAPPTCSSSGDYTLDNFTSGSLGPIKIPGSMTISNGATLTVTGTIWVQGTISLSNNAIIRLDPSYSENSGLIIADGDISVSNGVTFFGSGQAGSYFMLLSAQNDPNGVVINISNNALGVIYYANNGKIHFSNNATAKEATGYGIELDNNASITYESGLANINFSSGPSGGWDIRSWQEVIP